MIGGIEELFAHIPIPTPAVRRSRQSTPIPIDPRPVPLIELVRPRTPLPGHQFLGTKFLF